MRAAGWRHKGESQRHCLRDDHRRGFHRCISQSGDPSPISASVTIGGCEARGYARRHGHPTRRMSSPDEVQDTASACCSIRCAEFPESRDLPSGRAMGHRGRISVDVAHLEGGRTIGIFRGLAGSDWQLPSVWKPSGLPIHYHTRTRRDDVDYPWQRPIWRDWQRPWTR